MKTNKMILAIGFITLLSNTMNAQMKIYLGAMGGLNMSGLYAEEDPRPDETETIKPGYSLTAALEFSFYNKVSLEAEVSYLQKGSKQELKDIFEITHKLTYLEFPILVKFNIDKADDYDVQLFAGPVFGILQNQTLDVTTTIPNATVTSFKASEFQDTETGMTVGVSARQQLKKHTGQVTFDLRLNAGLSPAVKSAEYGKVRNIGVVVALGYTIPLL